MCLCFFHISLSHIFLIHVSLSLSVCCVWLSLLSEPAHTVAKSWLRTGGFILSHFARAVAQSKIVKGLGWGQNSQESKVEAKLRPESGAIPAPALPHVTESPGPHLPSSSPVMEAGRRLVLINLGVKNQSLLVTTEVRDSMKASGWGITQLENS